MLSVGTMETLTRAGFAARGIMYFLIGYLALQTGRTEDGSGILLYLNSGAGKLVLAVMALGFMGYGIWRLSEAMVDSEGHGNDAKGMAIRAGGVASGLIHLFLAFLAARLALGSDGEGTGAGGGAEEGAAAALNLPGGPLLVMIGAAALLLTGLYQLVKAYRGEFLKHLARTAAARDWVKWLGRGGYAARGVVFLIMAWFLWQAADTERAAEAGDMGAALGWLTGMQQTVVAAGLLLFGLFSLIEARYRRIHDPHVIDRMRAAARTVRY